MRWIVPYAAAAVALLLVAMACQDEETPVPPPDETATVVTRPGVSPADEAEVEMEDLSFQPPELRVKVGTTVVWKNRDDVTHTATEGQPGTTTGFRSPQLNDRDEFSHTFEEAGTFDYYCEVHPTMLGAIIVEP